MARITIRAPKARGDRAFWETTAVIGARPGDSTRTGDVQPMHAAEIREVWAAILTGERTCTLAEIDRWRSIVAGLGEHDTTSWAARNRLLLVILVVLVIALSEPAIASALPPELRHLLELEHGPLAYGLAVVGAIVGTAAVTGRKG